jgi:putative transposase
MCKWLTAWRSDEWTGWLAEGHSQVQQQVLKRLHQAYQRFFDAAKAGTAGRGRGRTGAPQFKGRGDDPGLRFPEPKTLKFDAVNGRLKVPKLGWLRLRMSREVVGRMANATITREGARWFVSIQVEQDEVLPSADLQPTLGIDLGLAQFASFAGSPVCIEGSQVQAVAPLKALARQQRRLKRLQRSVSRKKKRSANCKKAIHRLGALHRRIARQREDWLHKLTTQLAAQHPVIAIEDLRVAAMSASAKGTASEPGANVAQKAALNRSILDAAWGEFRRQLDYKLAAVGGQLIAVPPAYTSQTCSACGHVHKGNRPSQALFLCLACGHAENADTNAAKNILAAGHAVWAERKLEPAACGEDVRRAKVARPKRASSMKQEPTEESRCVTQ